jgi:hypothetical protein
MTRPITLTLSDDEALYARCLAHCAETDDYATQQVLYALESVCVEGTVTLTNDQAAALAALLRGDRDAEMALMVAGIRARLKEASAKASGP